MTRPEFEPMEEPPLGGPLASDRWIAGTQHWLEVTTAPTAVATGASLLTLLGMGLVLRSLSSELAGFFVLSLAIWEILIVLAALGSNTVLVRRYSRAGVGDYNWPLDILSTLAFGMPVILAGIAVVRLFYDLPGISSLYILLATPLGVLLRSTAYVLNAQRHHVWFNLLLRLPKALLVFPAVLFLLSPKSASLELVLIVHAGFVGAVLILGAILLSQTVSIGEKRLRLSERVEGLVFLVSSMGTIASDHGILTIAGLLLTPSHLGNFAAMAILLRPFRMLKGILETLMVPELIQKRGRHFRQILGGVVLTAAMGTIGAMLIVPPLARWFYAGAYRQGLVLIPLLALAGGIHLSRAVPSADLRGNGPQRLLNRFVFVSTVGLAFGLGVGTSLMLALGLEGLGWTVLILELLTTTIALLFWVWLIRMIGDPGTQADEIEVEGL